MMILRSQQARIFFKSFLPINTCQYVNMRTWVYWRLKIQGKCHTRG